MGTRLTRMEEILMRIQGITIGTGVHSYSRTVEPVLTVVPFERERSAEGLVKVFIIDGGDVCAICLEEMKEGDDARALGCSHTFHSNCISQWATEKSSCPLCRFDMPMN